MSAVFQAVFQAKPGDDSQRRFLAQHSVAKLFRIVATLFQHCNAVINFVPRVLSYLPIEREEREPGTRLRFDPLKYHRCGSSRVTSP